MSGARTDNGLNVRLLLPHVVYLNQKQPLRKTDVVVRAFQVDPVGQKARLQLENLGPNLGRVLQVSLKNGHSGSDPVGGFPLFPRSRRWIEVPWRGEHPPTAASVRFARFSIDTVLTPTTLPPATTVGAALRRP
jgi:hypothetical protein